MQIVHFYAINLNVFNNTYKNHNNKSLEILFSPTVNVFFFLAPLATPCKWHVMEIQVMEDRESVLGFETGCRC